MSAPGVTVRLLAGSLTPEALFDVKSLMAACFGSDAIRPGFEENLTAQRSPLLVLAAQGGRPLGFKYGYAKSAAVFHSWLGGVHPDGRRHGIGRALMRAQHRWCRSQGYSTITTVSKNEYREMIILNLREGFNIVGTECGLANGELSIQFEKRLVGASCSAP